MRLAGQEAIGRALKRALWTPRPEWAQGPEWTAWAPRPEQALEGTLRAHGMEWALERTLERTLWAHGTEQALGLQTPGG